MTAWCWLLLCLLVGSIFEDVTAFSTSCNNLNPPRHHHVTSVPRYRTTTASATCSTSTSSSSLAATSSSSPFDTIVKGVKDFIRQQTSKSGVSSPYGSAEKSASAIRRLTEAADTKAEDEDAVVQALLDLEQGQRELAKVDPSLSPNTLKNLNGSWRLVFTTNTKETQQKKLIYFPFTAIRSFNTDNMRITDAIYVGDLAVVKFFGTFEWLMDRRKLEFDFSRIELLGGIIGFRWIQGEAVSSFNWILADTNIATARSGGGALPFVRQLLKTLQLPTGGGLTLWKRDLDMEKVGD